MNRNDGGSDNVSAGLVIEADGCGSHPQFARL
jgi:hypothetical protein